MRIPVPHRTPQIDSLVTRLPPYSRFTIARVPIIAVKHRRRHTDTGRNREPFNCPGTNGIQNDDF